MNAAERRPQRTRFRTTPIQLFFLVSAVFYAAITPVPIQFGISGIILVLVCVAMTVTTFRKERAVPEVFLEEEHFDGGGTIPVGRSRLNSASGISQVYFAVHPMFRMLVLSPTQVALEFSLAYGLGRFFGPWTLRREDVLRVERDPVWYVAHDPIRIITISGTKSYFHSHEPGTVLACLEELGYPVVDEAPLGM